MWCQTPHTNTGLPAKVPGTIDRATTQWTEREGELCSGEIAKSKVAENSDLPLCAANEKTNENQTQD